MLDVKLDYVLLAGALVVVAASHALTVSKAVRPTATSRARRSHISLHEVPYDRNHC